MVAQVNYWYNKQIRHIIMCALRVFSNFSISEGLDSSGNHKLRRIPVTFMSSDKSVAYLINNGTDTILESCPKMILTISKISLNNDKQSGAPYYEYESSITEKLFDEEKDNYVNKVGNSYNITRLNPLPLGITFKLYILTSMLDQKFQLFEQMRAIFSPTLEFQTSENPLDWSRVTAMTLTDMNWTSVSTSNLDGSTLDSMDLTFEINTNFDLPSLVQKESMVEQIVNSINSGDSLDDIMSWDLSETPKTIYSPSNNRIEIRYNEAKNRQEAILLKNENCKSWYELINAYGLPYNTIGTTSNIHIHCLTNSNIDIRNDIVGNIFVIPSEPNVAIWNIETTLPQSNYFIDGVINPHDFTFEYQPKDGMKFLIDSDLPSNTQLWGKLYNELDEEVSFIPKNCIITYTNNSWKILLNPNNTNNTYYITDITQPQYIFTFNSDYKIWVDLFNKKYGVGFWRISSFTNK